MEKCPSLKTPAETRICVLDDLSTLLFRNEGDQREKLSPKRGFYSVIWCARRFARMRRRLVEAAREQAFQAAVGEVPSFESLLLVEVLLGPDCDLRNRSVLQVALASYPTGRLPVSISPAQYVEAYSNTESGPQAVRDAIYQHLTRELPPSVSSGVIPAWAPPFVRAHAPDEMALATDLETRAAEVAEGMSLIGKADQAASLLERALGAVPESELLQLRFGLANLQRGSAKVGWHFVAKYYEKVVPPPPGVSGLRSWDGSTTSSRIALWSWKAPGIGAEVMRLAFVQSLIQCCPNVTLICDQRLHPAIKRSFPSIKVLGYDGAVGHDHEMQCNLMRLPAFYWDDRKSTISYLKPDCDMVDYFRTSYRWDKKPVVGLSWFTPNKRRGRRRSIPTDMISNLAARHPSITFVSLQHDMSEEDLRIASDITVDPTVDPKADVDRLLAQIASLDAVVTVDNSVAHFSGGLGIPTLVLLAKVPDPQWGAEGDSISIYEHSVLLRQKSHGDWSAPLAQVSQFLERLSSAPQRDRKSIVSVAKSIASGVSLAAPYVAQLSRPKALIVNFTGHAGHFGMMGTSLAVLERLIALGYDVDVLPAEAISEALGRKVGVNTLLSWSGTKDLIEQNQDIVRQICSSDRVIFHGEGTLHGIRPSSLRLLYLMSNAKRLGKECDLLNFSLFPSSDGQSTTGDEGRVYERVIRYLNDEGCTFVPREDMTATYLHTLGVPHKIGFDTLPLAIETYFPELRWKGGDQIIVSGGMATSESQLRKIGTVLASSRRHSVYLTGGSDQFVEYDLKQYQVIRSISPKTQFIRASSLENFLTVLAERSALLVTGRFHYLIAASSIGVPSVGISSNTPKIEAVAAQLGINEPVQVSAASFAKRLALSMASATTGPNVLPALARLGDVNFEHIPDCGAALPINDRTEQLLRVSKVLVFDRALA